MTRASALVPLLVAAAIFLGCIVSPPSLMDDVDSVQAQIARNMLQSGDWVTARFGAWAFGQRAGMYAGLVLATSVGLFLFTRILIPDAILTLTVTVALWALMRATEEEEPHPRRWAAVMW